MQSTKFDYHRPDSLAEALDLLSSTAGARPLAGGHSLLPLMKRRLATPAALIDLSRIPGLSGVSTNGDGVTIGAMTTHADVAASAAVRDACSVVAETAGIIGDQQVRNRGTIGGSVAHVDPAADLPPVLQAVGASIVVTGPGGERTIAASEFFVDMFTSALADGEIVTAVQVPALNGKGAAYAKHPHPASSYAVVGAAAVVSVSGGSVSSASVVIGGATVTPVRAGAAEAALTGSDGSAEAIAAAAAEVSGAITDPVGDTYASGAYRAHLAGILTRRALTEAVSRAG